MNRRFSGGIFALILLFLVGCGWLEEQWTLKQIERAEYTRDSKNPGFVRWLNHRRERVRLRAVEALGRIQDTTRAVLLANRLADPEEAVREAAAFALGQLFHPAAEPPLLQANANEKSPRVKSRIAEALGKSGTQKCFLPLADFLESEIPEYEQAGAIACGILAYRDLIPVPNIGRLSTLLLRSPRWQTRWRAAYALYRIHNLSTMRALFRSLEDTTAYVRVYALQAMGTMLARLNTLDMNRYRNNPVVREALVIRNSEELGNLLQTALQDSLWYVRLQALDFLGLAGMQRLHGFVEQALQDPHPAIRMKALEVYAALRGPLAAARLYQMARQADDWRLRGKALSELAGVDSLEALHLIKQNFDPTRWPENYFVIQALEKIRSQAANRLLQQLVEAGILPQATLAMEVLVDLQRPLLPSQYFLEKLALADPALTTVIATHFRYRKDSVAVQPLVEAFGKFQAPRDLETMEAILLALDSLATPGLIPFFEEQLANPYPRIRQISLRVLKRLRPNQAISLPEVEERYAIRWDFPRVDREERPRVVIQTSRGNIVLELRPDKAPVTVANFLHLVRQGFYQGIYFHRVVPGFVVQAGDPRGDGWGGPGYAIPCEYNDLFYHRGVIGMAHAGKDTGGSQFFITQLPQPHLNGRYTAFGKVVAGMEVVDSLMVYDRILSAKIVSQ